MKAPHICGRQYGLQISFVLGFLSNLLLIYSNSLFSRRSASLQPRDQPSAANQSNVYRWTGREWEKLLSVCTWSDLHHCTMLKTANGNTPLFHHDPKDDYTSKLIVQSGVKEPHTIRSVLDYLASDLTVTFLDVGSHVGSIALQIAKAGYTVVTVDPLPENIVRLCKSVEVGGFVDTVTILFSPVSNNHKTVEFKRKWNIGETKVQEVQARDKTSSPHTAAPSCELPPLISKAATLDDILPFIKSEKVFVKIDVESHEYFVVEGGAEFFKHRRVVGIFMEWIHVKSTPEANTLIRLLNSYGFTAYNLDNMNVSLVNENYKNWPMDIIWKRS